MITNLHNYPDCTLSQLTTELDYNDTLVTCRSINFLPKVLFIYFVDNKTRRSRCGYLFWPLQKALGQDLSLKRMTPYLVQNQPVFAVIDNLTASLGKLLQCYSGEWLRSDSFVWKKSFWICNYYVIWNICKKKDKRGAFTCMGSSR